MNGHTRERTTDRAVPHWSPGPEPPRYPQQIGRHRHYKEVGRTHEAHPPRKASTRFRLTTPAHQIGGTGRAVGQSP
jgi:hypothetical protein